jgi:NitT/TauT family transport system substrate-binding protein
MKANKSARKATQLIALMLVAAFGLGACAPPPAAPTAQPTQPDAQATVVPPTAAPMDQVSMRLSWRWKSEFAALVAAEDMGYFAEQNIAIQILESGGSGEVVPLLANKNADFAYLNLNTVAIGIDRDLPLIVVAGVMAKHPSALAYFSDQAIQEPKDLEGKTLALAPGEAFAIIYPAFAQRWDIDTSRVTTVQLDGATKNQAFLEGRIDVLPLFVNNELPLLRSQTDRQIEILVPAEYGFNTIANGIVTHKDTVRDNPDLVRRMVAAIIKGYEYALANPEAALDMVLQRSPELASQPREVHMEQLTMTLDFIHSPATEGHRIGWMADEDWNYTLDLLHETEATSRRLSNDEVYTNEFVP